MKRILVILDSCRYDLYRELYDDGDLPFLERLGKPLKSHTHSNITSASFVLFFSHGVFPYPKPKGFGIKPQYNLIETYKGKTAIVLGTPMIYPKHLSVRAIMNAFDYVNFTRRSDICKVGVDFYNEAPEKPDLFVLWCNETHHPFNYEVGQTDWEPHKINNYNRGRDPFGEEYLDYLKSRQKAMIAYCDGILSSLKLEEPTMISLTSDHGESIGEDHKIGHGNSLHPIQFTVPFQNHEV